MTFFAWMKSSSESLSDRVRSITSHLVILQHPNLTDWRTDLAVVLHLNLPNKLLISRLCSCAYNHAAFIVCGCAFILFLMHFTSYFRSTFRSVFRVPFCIPRSVPRSCIPAFTVGHFDRVTGCVGGRCVWVCMVEGRVCGCVYGGGWCVWWGKVDVLTKSGQWKLINRHSII